MNILANSKIRTKLLINCALLLCLFILAMANYQFALDRVEAGYQKIIYIRHNIFDKALLIKERIQSARKNENAFLLHPSKKDAEKAFQDTATLINNNSELLVFAKSQNMADIVKQVKIIEIYAKYYDDDFHSLVQAHEKKGLTHKLGLQGEFRKIAHDLANIHLSEHALGPILNSIHKIKYLSHNKTIDTRTSITLEMAHLDKLLKTYRARPIYMNTLGDLLAEFRADVKHYLASPLPIWPAVEDLSGIDLSSGRLFDALYPIYVPDVQSQLLQIRKHEKDYLLRSDIIYQQKLHTAVTNLKNSLKEHVADPDDSNASIQSLTRYQEIFDQLVSENNKIQFLLESLHTQAKMIEQASDVIVHVSTNQSKKRSTEILQQTDETINIAIALCLVALIIGLALSLWITNSITNPLQAILAGLTKMTDGDYSVRLTAIDNEKSDTGILARMFNQMAHTISENNWFTEGQNILNEKLREDKEEQQLCREIINFLATYLNMHLGAIYLRKDDNTLYLTESYAYNTTVDPPLQITLGEGLLGEAARGGKLLIINDAPSDYIQIKSSLGQCQPASIAALPFNWHGEILAVVELASIHSMTKRQIKFLEVVSESIAISLNGSRQRSKTIELLLETQRQSEELQTQQEELKTANEELVEQAHALRQSEEELKSQQEELQVNNEELEEKSNKLALQNATVNEKNKELETAKYDIEQKAKEVSNASRYKSEFLANMSHELRTPLNSLLLLARNLAQNKNNNLDKNQVTSANIIYNSGNDLLILINDILDLSKIEAGHMEVAHDLIGIRGFGDWLNDNFQHMAKEKNLDYSVEIEPLLPTQLTSDRQRLEQIMRNLVGNAIKFTETGSVTVHFGLSKTSESFSSKQLINQLGKQQILAISVSDTGIGISEDQQQFVFDAFKQADGGTSRKYGGTGLGLSISRELANLLGGEIQLKSVADKGSTFTLYLPIGEMSEKQAPLAQQVNHQIISQDMESPALSPPRPKFTNIVDDRDHLKENQKTILIIEDDQNFAKILQKLAHDKGYECLLTPSGTEGLELAEQYKPSAIILDIRLPDIDGWQVLENLKNNASLRHIPVHMMSGEEKTIEAMKKGAIGFLTKPISEENLHNAFSCLEDALSKRLKDLLVVEDDSIISQEIMRLLEDKDIQIRCASCGAKAIEDLKTNNVDCMILDIGLPDMTGFELLDQLEDIEGLTIPPVIIYTGRELTRKENDSLRKYTDTVIIKGIKSEERLLDETALFLHRLISEMPPEKRQMIASLHDQDQMFRDKKILVVDDDMRNAFALSRILEERGMKISIANDGKHALKLLAENSPDLVLMDIMMPVMNGYECMTQIRAQEKFHDLPIIALTAKAMTSDKEKCMASGASDYLAKPVEEGKLLSMMRVWLYR